MIITEDTTITQKKARPSGAPRRGSDYLIWRDEVSAELQARNHFDAAERWDYCDNSPRFIINRNKVDLPPSSDIVWVCSRASDHDAVLFSPTCDFRICPDCAKRHTARLMNRFLPRIEEMMTLHPEYRLRSITLTTKLNLDDLDFKKTTTEGFNWIQRAMRKVVGKNWNKKGAGMLANWEVGPKGLLLHYHLIYFGPWVDQKKLSKTWLALTGNAYNVWVTKVKHNETDWQGAISEVLKYATKFYSEDKDTGERIYLSASLTVTLYEALKGTRRIRSWGSFYNIGQDEERVFCCTDCNAKMQRIHVSHFEIWRETGFTPDGWKSAIRESLLYLRRADKLEQNGSKTKIPDPPTTRQLAFMDGIPIKTKLHYDYE